jgi:hypothetical protein
MRVNGDLAHLYNDNDSAYASRVYAAVTLNAGIESGPFIPITDIMRSLFLILSDITWISAIGLLFLLLLLRKSRLIAALRAKCTRVVIHRSFIVRETPRPRRGINCLKEKKRGTVRSDADKRVDWHWCQPAGSRLQRMVKHPART